jgi:paraquat-inducible protein B
MSEKPHSVAIGAFILGALIILVMVLLYIGGSGIGRNREKVVMVFDGSVKGLSIGASVALRGVQIGQVTDIDVIFDSDSLDLIMVVEAEINGENVQRTRESGPDLVEELIARGLRAQLNSQSLLTGLLYIQLDFHPGSELVLVPLETPYIQIPTIPTELERLTRQFNEVDFATLVDDAEAILAGLREFSTSLEFRQLPAQLASSLDSLEGLTAQLSVQLASTGPKLDSSLKSADLALKRMDSSLEGLVADLRQSLAGFDRAVASADLTIRSAGDMVSEGSPTQYQLNEALRELALAGRALRSLVRTLEEQPESLIRGRRTEEAP